VVVLHRDDDDRDPSRRGIGLQRSEHLLAAPVREAQVEYDAQRSRAADGAERRLDARDDLALQSDLGRDGADEIGISAVVVHDEHARAAHRLDQGIAEVHAEGRALPRLALEADAPAVELDQALREREAESGSLAAEATLVETLERPEHPAPAVRRDADP